jgi:hypothetical protein
MTRDAMEPGLQSGTGQGLIEFLDFTIERGQLVGATGTALRTGVRKVLETSPELYDTDMRGIDVDEVVRVFRNKARGTAKDKTIDQYEQRFRQSVEMYRKWLADDRDWLPARARSGASRPRPASTAGARSNGSTADPLPSPDGASVDLTPQHLGLVTYPLPLRPGVKATLILPEDLTSAEAHRISSFVSAIAFEDTGARKGDTAS